jgi:hypothetical protein
VLAHGPTAAAKPPEPLERSLLAGCGALSASLVVGCGLMLAGRRLGGGFEPIGGPGSLAVAALGGLLILACDAAASGVGLAQAWRYAARLGYVCGLIAIALPFRGSIGLDAALFVAAAGLAGAVVGAPWLRAGALLRTAHPRTAHPRTAAPTPRADVACPGHLLQRFERYELDGFDCLHGMLSLEIPAGSRTASGHIGFCPSFRQMPRVEASTLYDGVEALVTAAEIVPWGVRIECRLDEPADEPIEIPVDVVARAPV